jgi:two-component system, LytTR family, response regulator LytT
MKIRCIAVDDEPLAVKQISAYIQKTPFLELAAGCLSAVEALDALNKSHIDLMFIDINMPDINGMDLVRSLTVKPLIVFTTAYSEHAVEGFKVDATDYLLKPISYSSFLKAANKAKQLIDGARLGGQASVNTTIDHLFVRSEYKLIRIALADIKYIESMHEYVMISLAGGAPVKTMVSMKSMEEQLPPDRFMRVHRSFIVNLSKITAVERGRIAFDGKVYIPVSDHYKTAFQQFIDKNFLI